MVRAGELGEEFKDIEKRELQIYVLAKGITIQIQELKLILSGRIKVSPESVPQPIERLDLMTKSFQEILALTNSAFRDAKKGEGISKRCNQELRGVVTNLQWLQQSMPEDKDRERFQLILGLLEKEIGLI